MPSWQHSAQAQRRARTQFHDVSIQSQVISQFWAFVWGRYSAEGHGQQAKLLSASRSSPVCLDSLIISSFPPLFDEFRGKRFVLL
jgi:hypothetical protein